MRKGAEAGIGDLSLGVTFVEDIMASEYGREMKVAFQVQDGKTVCSCGGRGSEEGGNL